MHQFRPNYHSLFCLITSCSSVGLLCTNPCWSFTVPTEQRISHICPQKGHTENRINMAASGGGSDKALRIAIVSNDKVRTFLKLLPAAAAWSFIAFPLLRTEHGSHSPSCCAVQAKEVSSGMQKKLSCCANGCVLSAFSLSFSLAPAPSCAGKMCIEVSPASKLAFISEDLCIGCGICVKKCPFEAISIINLPKNLDNQTTHRYGPNSFKLHRLPMPRGGEVLGLVGTNGIGKSTALKILSAKMKPNLGQFDEPPTWEEILKHFRGSELQGYFTRILDEKIRAVIKPQYVDHIPRAVKGQVGAIISAKDKRGVKEQMLLDLQLDHVQEREIALLSGGELQRFAIAVVAVQEADVYMFDEPSSYLDVKQRMKAANTIRGLLEGTESARKYVICVEHDLAVLDYLSDFICCLYGSPSAYGVVTMPFSVREGINIFLAGFVPTENLRFRDEELTFKVARVVEEDAATRAVRKKKGKKGKKGAEEEEEEEEAKAVAAAPAVPDLAGTRSYPAMNKHLASKKGSSFTLHVEAGSFSDSQIIVMLGENGTGKTTFIRMLAGLMEADAPPGEDPPTIDGFSVSYKPQKISPKFEGSVRLLLHNKVRDAYLHPQFATDVTKPLNLDNIIDQEVKNLSGGELQRVAIILCLGKPADVYLIDEPSAYLDSEQRIVAAKVIKRYILHAKRTAFVVEHDFIMATYLADQVIVYDGQPGVESTAHAPESLVSGMNKFLAQVGITFRRDPTNYRPRINKKNSDKDREQKREGTYFYNED